MKQSLLTITALGTLLATLFFGQWVHDGALTAAILMSIGFGSAVIMRKHRFLFLIATVFTLIGLTRIVLSWHTLTPNDLAWYRDSGEEVTISGWISDEPDIRSNGAKYTVSAETIIDTKGEHRISGKVLASVMRYPQYQYGDTVKVVGKLRAPGIIDEFSYEHYLAISGIESVIYQAEIERIGVSMHVSQIKQSLFSLKSSFEDRINHIFPEPAASFLAGLLTGSRKGIPADVTADFQITGLTHIIAISGYNITIIIAIVTLFFGFLPRRIAFFLSIGAIVLFTIFVGASSSVVRAAIMGIIGLLALQSGRQQMALITILLAACAMALYRPAILWYDVSFHLSFLAVIGLVFLSPLWERWFKKIPNILALRESLQMTLAAQVAAVPIIVSQFGNLSLIAPIANLLVVPVIPFAMLFGFFAVVLGMIAAPFQAIFGFITYTFLEYAVFISHLLASTPYASLKTSMPNWLFIAYYCSLFAGVTWWWQRRRQELTKTHSTTLT